MRLAADDALVDSGLAGELQRAFGRDTGVAVKLLSGPASSVLQALERGENDAALSNAPEVERGARKTRPLARALGPTRTNSVAATARRSAWYLQAPAGGTLLEQARTRKACTVVERGVWAMQGGGTGYAELAPGDPRLAVDVRVMRSFRVNHPGAKLFVQWVSGAMGQRVAAGVRGYHAPAR
ncbi:MAG TPA: hypothetical protein VKI18_03060 [Albitalea sp.]|nr:hypothetical protein [Albitalea sp.]